MIPAQLPAGVAGMVQPERERPQPGGDAWRATWQREVERHQAADWFGHGLVGGRGAAASPAAPSQRMPVSESAETAAQPGDGQQARAQPTAARAAPRPLAPPDASRPQPVVLEVRAAAARPARASSDTAPVPGPQQDAQDCAAPAQRNALAPPAPTATATAWRIDDRSVSATDSADAAEPAARQQQQAPAREGVRVHAEWSDAGVRLWLGIDAAVAGDKSRLIQQVQRSVARSGYRVLAMTCNGQAVHQRPLWLSDLDGFTPTESTTWPSVQ